MDALDFLASDNYIILNKSLAKEIGLENAIVFGALCSYQRMCKTEEFYKEQEKIIEDTCLTEYLVRKATKELVNLGLITVEKKGLPAKYYFKINTSSALKILTSSGANFDTTSGNKIDTTSGNEIDTTKENNNKNNNINNNKLIKEIQKEKAPLEIVFEHWNSKDIIKHKQITKDIEKAYEKASKELKLSTEDIKLAIDRYNEVLKAEGYYFKYKWSLAQFLSRGLGIKEFLDEGSKWVNYIDWKNKNGKTSMQPHYKPSKAKVFNPDIDKVEEINVNLDVDI